MSEDLTGWPNGSSAFQRGSSTYLMCSEDCACPGGSPALAREEEDGAVADATAGRGWLQRRSNVTVRNKVRWA